MTDRGNRRAHPRVELLVQVQVRRELEVHIMSMLNVSMGGAFIQGEPDDYPELETGTELEILIFDAAHPDTDDVSLQARVVRLERGKPGKPNLQPGFGLQFRKLNADQLDQLKLLVDSSS